jgi:hypothetical protein
LEILELSTITYTLVLYVTWEYSSPKIINKVDPDFVLELALVLCFLSTSIYCIASINKKLRAHKTISLQKTLTLLLLVLTLGVFIYYIYPRLQDFHPIVYYPILLLSFFIALNLGYNISYRAGKIWLATWLTVVFSFLIFMAFFYLTVFIDKANIMGNE